MQNSANHFQAVGEIVDALDHLGLEPILIGGMALVILGSRRVTRDFDFVIATPDDKLQKMLTLFYDRGFEMAAQVDADGDITLTVDNPRVAAIRVKMDGPESIFMINRKTGLRIDLLFDFPIPAAELAQEAEIKTIRSHAITVASKKDLLRLKEIARSKRKTPNDTQDIAFLKAHRKKNR